LRTNVASRRREMRKGVAFLVLTALPMLLGTRILAGNVGTLPFEATRALTSRFESWLHGPAPRALGPNIVPYITPLERSSCRLTQMG